MFLFKILFYVHVVIWQLNLILIFHWNQLAFGPFPSEQGFLFLKMANFQLILLEIRFVSWKQCWIFQFFVYFFGRAALWRLGKKKISLASQKGGCLLSTVGTGQDSFASCLNSAVSVVSWSNRLKVALYYGESTLRKWDPGYLSILRVLLLVVKNPPASAG